MFCAECMAAWLNMRARCPTCNHRLTADDVRQVDRQTYEVPQNAGPATASTSTELAPTSANQRGFPFPPAHKLPKIIGNYSSKITLITKHIKYLVQMFPSTFKCLVFSQWEEVLDLFQQALKQNDIGVVRFGSSAAGGTSAAPIRFRSDPSLKVFMLNARSQCAGLTLVCATHVFLIEPSINPAIEYV